MTLRVSEVPADAILYGNVEVRSRSRHLRHCLHRWRGKRYELRTRIQRPALGMT